MFLLGYCRISGTGIKRVSGEVIPNFHSWLKLYLPVIKYGVPPPLLPTTGSCSLLLTPSPPLPHPSPSLKYSQFNGHPSRDAICTDTWNSICVYRYLGGTFVLKQPSTWKSQEPPFSLKWRNEGRICFLHSCKGQVWLLPYEKKWCHPVWLKMLQRTSASW